MGKGNQPAVAQEINARTVAVAAARLQAVGERLVRLPPGALDSLGLGDNLRDALLESQRLPPRTEALRRQLQYVGKLMRSADIETVERELEALENGAAATLLQRRVELWRERLLAEADEGINALVLECPGVARQRLRQLVRRVAKEAVDSPQRRRHERALAAELRVILGSTPTL
jgi:ribosome-associated protein